MRSVAKIVQLIAVSFGVYLGLLALIPVLALALGLGLAAAVGLAGGAASLAGAFFLSDMAGVRAAAIMLFWGGAAFAAMCVLFNGVGAAWARLRRPRDAAFGGTAYPALARYPVTF